MPIRERIALPGEKELGKKERFPRTWVAPGAKSSEDVGSSCATNRKNLSFRGTLGADGVKEESAWGWAGVLENKSSFTSAPWWVWSRVC